MEEVKELSAKERSMAARIFIDGESRTQQHMAESCDINVIVRRFGVTGQVPIPSRLPEYGDFTGVGDYQSCLNAVILADDMFSQLPASLRREFGNDPQRYLEFVSNPDNADKMVDMGLASKRTPSPVDSGAPPQGAAPSGGGVQAPTAPPRT